MPSSNFCSMRGILVADPHLAYTRNGAPVCNFTLEVARIYRTQTGERKTDTICLPTTAWGRLAEVCATKLVKGINVGVIGHLQLRKLEMVERFECCAERVMYTRHPVQEVGAEIVSGVNICLMRGNLAADATLGTTATNVPVCTFDMAVNRFYRTAAGEQRKDTIYLPCSIYGTRASQAMEVLKKGVDTDVVGHLQTRHSEAIERVECVVERLLYAAKSEEEDVACAS